MYSIHNQWYSRAFIYLRIKSIKLFICQSEVRFIILLEFAMRVNPTRIAKWGVILLWPSIFQSFNRPLPSSKKPHFPNEAKSSIFLVKMSFICMRMKNHFHIKEWALNHVLIQRHGGTRNWHIGLDVSSCLATRQGVNKTATIMAWLF